MPDPSAAPAASIDLARYFHEQARRDPPYAGQATTTFQAAMQDHHADVGVEDCEFYHTVELTNGDIHRGEWDLRGREDTYLGGVSLSGQRVIEYGPASGWLSAYIARRAAALTTFDLPFGSAADVMPFPEIDFEAARQGGVDTFTRIRNSWWFTRRSLGFEATAIYADIYDPPADLGTFDVAVFGSILLHLANPFRALQRAAERVRNSIVVTDILGPQEDLPRYAPGFDPTMALLVFGPSKPPSGVVHWWAMSSGAVTLMLHRLGFTSTSVILHPDMPLFTVVGHRPGADSPE